MLMAPPFIFALTFHEFAHAWSANKLNDPTAKNEGRLSLNPLVHLDPVGTIMLLLESLEDNDDVQRVSSNFEISEELMAKLSA